MMVKVAWLWFCLAGMCMGLVSIGCLFSLVLRLSSQLGDLERKLKASQQAHALDVQAFTKKLKLASNRVNHE